MNNQTNPVAALLAILTGILTLLEYFGRLVVFILKSTIIGVKAFVVFIRPILAHLYKVLGRFYIILKYKISITEFSPKLIQTGIAITLIAIYAFSYYHKEEQVKAYRPVMAVAVSEPLDERTPADELPARRKVLDVTVGTGYFILDDFVPVSTEEEEALSYFKRFYKTAQEEQDKYGIPASISLMQGKLESGNGKSKLATKANNHFGVKCFSKHCKKGHCINFSDDSHKDFFRKYSSAWESWRAHSKLIVSKYKSLLKHGTNYVEWAKGLKRLGYATAPHYDDALIQGIEKYKLYQFD